MGTTSGSPSFARRAAALRWRAATLPPWTPGRWNSRCGCGWAWKGGMYGGGVVCNESLGICFRQIVRWRLRKSPSTVTLVRLAILILLDLMQWITTTHEITCETSSMSNQKMVALRLRSMFWWSMPIQQVKKKRGATGEKRKKTGIKKSGKKKAAKGAKGLAMSQCAAPCF